MYLTQRHLSRRTVLKGLGAGLALPWLDAMMPAAARAATAGPQRLICMEMVHGSAGATTLGAAEHLWSPALAGRAFDLSPTSLRPLEHYRDRLTIVSGCDVPSAEPYDAGEIGGDHFRSSAVFLTQSHPKRTLGADVEAGISLDQLVAARTGQETPLPSMQLCIEPIDSSGGFSGGYAGTYTDTISWASPTRPLPMIRDPRVVFGMLTGIFGEGATPEARQASRALDRSILDWMLSSAASLRGRLGPGDRVRFDAYLDALRELERRLQAVERRNLSGDPRDLPSAPPGVPDSFTDHVKMLMDLQVFAFQTDATRVTAFKLGRDNSNRVYPESGVGEAFHPASHHGGDAERIRTFARLNTFHVGQVAYLLDRLSAIPDGDGSLLDRTLVLYGSPMGDSNQHNHKRVPFFLVGTAGGRIRGGSHLVAPPGTPLANVMLGVLHAMGREDLTSFGDSDDVFTLHSADAR